MDLRRVVDRGLSIVAGALLLFGFQGCSSEREQQPKITFYHWETTLAPSPSARRILDSLGCDQLYVKAFDLSYANGRMETQAWVEMEDTVGLPELIPVVFITNAVFRNLKNTTTEDLASDVVQLVTDLFGSDFLELQIDCDWTAGTKENYFAFLQAIKAIRPNIMLSCTVRLHQYRDRNEQGIPPVDRGTLMAYNTGNLNEWAEENSIYDPAVVKAYLKGQPDYPLDLDLAVAAYDWAAVYRRDKLAYLINEPDLTAMQDTSRFRQLSGERYLVTTSTYLNELYLYEGDLLRLEGMSQSSVPTQIAFLQHYVKSFKGQRAMIYRLGSRAWR